LGRIQAHPVGCTAVDGAFEPVIARLFVDHAIAIVVLTIAGLGDRDQGIAYGFCALPAYLVPLTTAPFVVVAAGVFGEVIDHAIAVIVNVVARFHGRGLGRAGCQPAHITGTGSFANAMLVLDRAGGRQIKISPGVSALAGPGIGNALLAQLAIITGNILAAVSIGALQTEFA
jgi:hypothetical protein